ncbi:hypothetical protein I79_000580 [Cricetulus griseus]|uniref:Uncharacterized protein n=1 Tax=Cricetulus griseus TaxID=10029 RepID=G3GSG8_CRIGR|nr:hypothetical protein I79_000580 [Cricetulus griseus]
MEKLCLVLKKNKKKKKKNAIGISLRKKKHGRQKVYAYPSLTQLIFKQGSAPVINNWSYSDEALIFLTLKVLLYISK